MTGLFRGRRLAVYVSVALAGAGAAGGGLALAAGSNTIHACAKKSSGALSLRHGSHCGKHQKSVSWSVQGPQGPRGATGATGPSRAQYAWSAFTYPAAEAPQSDGHVATFRFTSPAAGFALVTASFQIRIHNTLSNDCHVESQLASAPAVIGDVQPGGGPAGFIDQWVNPGLDTQDGGSTILGFGGSVSRVFPVLAGQNAVYLNGQYTGYTDSTHDCTQALWGPVTVSAVFANQNPSSTLTAP